MKYLMQIITVLFYIPYIVYLMGYATEKFINQDRGFSAIEMFHYDFDVNRDRQDTVIESGTYLISGDTLSTDSNGYTVVQLTDQSTVTVRPLSRLIIHGEIDRNQTARIRIDLNRGGVYMNVKRNRGNEIEVTTSSTVATVKGTAFGAQSSGYYWVEEGEVEVMALQSGQAVTVVPGMFAQIDETGADMITGQLSDNELGQLSKGHKALDEEQIQKRLILRFKDTNGQIIEDNADALHPQILDYVNE